jgi:hypothetical protein
MAEEMKWLKRHRGVGMTELYANVGLGCMIVMPALAIAFSRLNIQPFAHDRLWEYGFLGLLGLGCLLMAIIRLLDEARSELSALTFVLYQVLKDPDEEEEVISRATYLHLRRRLDLDS